MQGIENLLKLFVETNIKLSSERGIWLTFSNQNSVGLIQMEKQQQYQIDSSFEKKIRKEM
jgi:hypothetical protein